MQAKGGERGGEETENMSSNLSVKGDQDKERQKIAGEIDRELPLKGFPGSPIIIRKCQKDSEKK